MSGGNSWQGEKFENSFWFWKWVTIILTALEKMLQGTAGRYCVGNEVTVADIFLVPQVYNANRWFFFSSVLPRSSLFSLLILSVCSSWFFSWSLFNILYFYFIRQVACFADIVVRMIASQCEYLLQAVICQTSP